jgi:hypothetical protein
MRNDLTSALGLIPSEQRARIQARLGIQLEYVRQQLPDREMVVRVADGLTRAVQPVLFVLTDERLLIISESFSGSSEMADYKLPEIKKAVCYPIDWATITKLFGSRPKHAKIFIETAQANVLLFISEDSDIQFEAALQARIRGNAA